jgi:acyl-CoA synthetase (AMP-forming)/AMP-acid ligase II
MIYRSPWPPVDIPDVSLSELVLRGAEARGDKPALVEGPTGRTITYHQLASRVRRAAAGLAAAGIRKGDVVAICAPNIPEYVIAFHGAASIGAMVTTLNPLCTEQDMESQLADSRARVMITVPELLEKAGAAARATAAEQLYVIGEAGAAAAGGGGAVPFAALLEHGGDPPRVQIDPATDVVALPYSSGTTGVSKGVMLTHRNLVANLLQVDATGQVYEHDTLLAVLPFFHIYGMVVIMNLGLYRGATLVTMPRFDLEQYLQLIARHRVTFAHVVPPVMLALAKHPLVSRYDLSSLRTLFSGAAPLSDSLSRACAERLGVVVRQGYGMTEASPGTHLSPEDPAKIKSGSVGPVIAGTECQVVHVDTGAPCGPMQDGELWVRGPQVMKGYLNRPEATALTVDADGWLHTGDIGYADHDGHFFIVDRLKELIKCKGYQVPPAELEAVLLTHPAVADAAVIPAPDEECGEVPKAFVVLKSMPAGGDGAGLPTPDDLMAYVAGKVASYKRLRLLEFIDQVPKSPSGKILRRVLVARERERGPHA